MTPAAQEKIRIALQEIEAAQASLGKACESLSPIVGLVAEWERVRRLYDRVQAEWHRLNRRDGQFRLDSETEVPHG
jgi:hypothetical protein